MALSFFPFDFFLAPNISTKEKKKKIGEIKAQRSKVMDVVSHEV